MNENSAHIVFSKVPTGDYLQNFVSLPTNYGSVAYFQRDDIRAIYAAVIDNLSQLDNQVHFSDKLLHRKVLIKPNLVTVFHNLGTIGSDYPETTDPRVLDAVVSFIKRFTDKISIVESSGRGIPTRGAFKQTGLDRLAKYHGVDLIALEEQPVDRYILPKARVMKEVALPRIFSDVVRGEAYYISLPKMKTNLFTGVTLGSKNSMGILPYNLRQRNHNYALDQKLVDMMWLVKPNLTIIDGVVGGEGNCPAPVEPVQSGVIISGNHPTETDRAAIRFMGIDPTSIKLINCADESGFCHLDPIIHGDNTPHPFKSADPTLTSESFRKTFPNVKLLVGLSRVLPDGEKAGNLTAEDVQKMEWHCRGGCLAVSRYGFDMLKYEGLRTDFELTLLIGDGIQVGSNRLFYDHEGHTYSIDDFQGMPNTLAVGTCAGPMQGVADRFVPGCMPYPNSVHTALHQLTHTTCRILTPKNRFLMPLLFETLRTCESRKALIRRGAYIDLSLQSDDRISPLPTLSEADLARDWIAVDFDPMTKEEKRKLQSDENQAVLSTFR